MYPPATIQIFDDLEFKYCATIYRSSDRFWNVEIIQVMRDADIASDDYTFTWRTKTDICEINIWFKNQTDAAKFVLYA